VTDRAPQPGPDRDRVFGLLLFDAEESLARGEAEKAMVLSSRAVKERPDNFTARSLVERARRELLRGRRREKLEARILEAQRLLDAGQFSAAEKIVNSALKLIPDHAAALGLFTRLRDRPRASAAETEAERELERLSHGQAEQAYAAARAAHQSGQFRRALSLLRRGLRQSPDHAGLLQLLREAQSAVDSLDAERARRRALLGQVRAGLELLAAGDVPESLRLLRAVLREDPDNTRAQAAIQELRRVVVARRATAARTAAPEPRPPASGLPGAASASVPDAPAASGAARPVPVREAPRQAAPARSGVPVEILLPRTLRKATPAAWIGGGGALILVVLVLIAVSGQRAPARVSSLPAAPVAQPTTEPETPEAPGPLDAIEPGLRAAIEASLARYARALESADASQLATARPDLSPEARERRLQPFRGALNAATDLRVLEVTTAGDRASVHLLATDVVVGGSGAPQSSREETLRFERTAAGWALLGR